MSQSVANSRQSSGKPKRLIAIITVVETEPRASPSRNPLSTKVKDALVRLVNFLGWLANGPAHSLVLTAYSEDRFWHNRY
jgi:hypothetical protein